MKAFHNCRYMAYSMYLTARVLTANPIKIFGRRPQGTLLATHVQLANREINSQRGYCINEYTASIGRFLVKNRHSIYGNSR